MSLFTLAIISFARAFSIKEVGGTRTVRKKVVVVLTLFWSICATFGLLYMFVLAFSNLRMRNNMCIIYGMIFKRYVSDLEYIFQVIVIIINTICLASLFTSSAILFHMVKQSVLSTKRSSQDTKVTRSETMVIRLGCRLLLLLLCNAICWVPTLVIFSFITGTHGDA